jgi:hypothetical protein
MSKRVLFKINWINVNWTSLSCHNLQATADSAGRGWKLLGPNKATAGDCFNLDIMVFLSFLLIMFCIIEHNSSLFNT